MHHSPNALPPTERQTVAMDAANAAAEQYAQTINALLPEGRDKTAIMHKLRMMALVITDSIAHTVDVS